VSGSGISWAICKSAPRQTDNHASTPPLSFLQAGCPSCRPTNSVKALKAMMGYIISKYIIQFASERILKICEHLTNLQAKWLIVSYTPFAFDLAR